MSITSPAKDPWQGFAWNSVTSGKGCRARAPQREGGDACPTSLRAILQSVPRKRAYTYVLSLPERVIRSLGALSGGLLREIGNVALPASIRRTTLYRTMVDVALRFLIEEVGQVEGIYPSEGRLAA